MGGGISMNQYVMFELSCMGHGAKFRAFANEVNEFLFVLFSEDDIFAFRKAAFALGLALDERHGGDPMQITLDTLPNEYVLIAKSGNSSDVVLASFREIRGHYKANNNNKNE